MYVVKDGFEQRFVFCHRTYCSVSSHKRLCASAAKPADSKVTFGS